MATDLTGLTAEIEARIKLTAKRAIDMSTPEARLDLAALLAATFGTGAGKANQAWWDRRPLVGGANEELDLAGALTNAFGQTVTFASIIALLIVNRSGEGLLGQAVTDATIRIGGAASEWQGFFAAAGDKLDLVVGGGILVMNPTAAGWAVTATSADELKIENLDGADAAVYDIVVVGRQS